MPATATIADRLRKLDSQRAKWEQSLVREQMLAEATTYRLLADRAEEQGNGAYADHLRRHADKLTREATA